MIVKNIDDEKCKLFIDEQTTDNSRYRVSYVDAPTLGLTSKIRISVSHIDEAATGTDYEHFYGFDFVDEQVKSLEHFDDRNNSTGDNFYTDEPMAYYDQVMSSFERLIESGKSEFSPQALNIIADVKKAVSVKRGSK